MPALVKLHMGGGNALNAELLGGNARHLEECGRDKDARHAVRLAALDLCLGVSARAGREKLRVEVAHDAHDLIVVVTGEVAEDELAGLVLAIGQVQLVARAPPPQAQGRATRDETVPEQVEGEELARLTIHDGAVIVEHGKARLAMGGRVRLSLRVI